MKTMLLFILAFICFLIFIVIVTCIIWLPIYLDNISYPMTLWNIIKTNLTLEIMILIAAFDGFMCYLIFDSAFDEL